MFKPCLGLKKFVKSGKPFGKSSKYNFCLK